MVAAPLDRVPETLHPLLQKHWSVIADQLDSLPDQPDRFIDDLSRVLVGSDFVAEQLQRRSDLLAELCTSGDLYRAYDTDHYASALGQLLSEAENEAGLHRLLRQFRQREQVRLIWRDLTRLADMRATTRELSWLADACIDRTLDWLHDELSQRYGQPMARDSKGQLQPQRLVVLGMGKLGANELNLSSDIDLIFAFPHNGETDGSGKTLANQDFFIRLGKKLIQALDNITVDGFVFRVDMRLRPFGSAGPLAASFGALESYYQDQGREWERYAMIKARVVAGDKQAGAELLTLLRPFVYRKYIDFSAFESLRDMKQMINREVRRKGLEGNVKLGSGGIREVEFIAQAFQLIRGGRDSRLQQRELLNILPLLPEVVGMPEEAVDQLVTAYTLLRNTEHAIQAVADRQTQELPDSPLEQARLAFSMGYPDWPAFAAELEHCRAMVRQHFADVIAPAEEDESQADSDQLGDWLLLWQTEIDDQQAIELLAEKGFDDPAAAWQQLRDLRQSRTVQMLQQIASERLLAVLPSLLQAISRVDNASETLARVLKLVQAVLRRSAYLVLLAENPMALQQLVRLCAASPWFGEQLSKQPILLDELIDPRSLYAPPNKAELQAELRQQLLRIPEDDVEQLMEALRYFKHAHLLRVAASDITGALPLMKVSDYLTWTAEAILEAVLDIAWRNLTEKHGLPMKEAGVPCELDFIVLGYGKVGGIELSYGSDLDLVFIHDTDPNLFTDGDKSIANSVFFTRLGQRIIHILNTFTPSGQLYEVDMRLRPSGNSGLLVSSLKAFRDYQLNEAWTWEHQALVRARVVAGDPALQQRFEAVREEVLGAKREQDKLTGEVVEMREKMRSHLGSKNSGDEASVFHLKQDQGGIVDIEFMVQYCVLAHGWQYPELMEFTDNIRILDAVERVGLLPAVDTELLRETYKAYRSVGHRLTLQGQSGSVIDDREMTDCRDQVSRIWRDLMGSE
ncbi:bifunctional [glutamate--ammonia ligase]-adenylyl-L-tyrosine phosphorylase/[glutamate--ammonia-ligase] adenylyltransferase [Marinobacterium arenosum]|uniref:bifunctional [glutamate--ammonia ligase]-adenylyl-L-tyrosine phosphorylase/[glutamate--ammonia-ligase] adenylyltransferase n=1 Tax=Marinobacterium arenosum TaxID=2862496 RepID=UPI001C97EC8C|nr:bifunctional [glutamate--ammonia ligase]-adenylyl-L-tyrosine phosphorylase/[glutamate--ammonia-ligase] adenylyltransferase [Marinobacterium arenosum]MBY4676444.1 bifunctional [glutamate--ammonia ligase]-adenylyl-L-tyrosine phosphorylase/[glutamate--ammonia-ligase] adenylyltransferase [Marinobacterium arenosum]